MELPSPDRGHDGVRRALTTAGVAGAALTLSAAAAFPALAASSNHSNAGGHGASAAGGKDSTGHNPPGNNGTVFIHDVAGDHSPHNVPHVSCDFSVDFFGFDNGQSVTVSFAGQAPTGKDVALGGTWTGVVSTDDASGAGNDFDDELAFTADQLGVSTLGAPAKQGYHVTMTVATNEPGGKKSKVFWLRPCPGAAGRTTSGGETGGGQNGGGTTIGGVTGGASVGATTGTAVTAGTAATRGATVLGEKFTKPASVAGSSTALPFTGADIWRMVAAGLVLLGSGATFTVAARRRTSG